ncbi:MAG: hypothetical protein QXE64_01150 [Candidatus Pacearchaeota archaeon]
MPKMIKTIKTRNLTKSLLDLILESSSDRLKYELLKKFESESDILELNKQELEKFYSALGESALKLGNAYNALVAYEKIQSIEGLKKVKEWYKRNNYSGWVEYVDGLLRRLKKERKKEKE